MSDAHPTASVPPTPVAPAPHVERLASGIPGFDAITGGGLPAGRLYVLAGEPGAGKTVFAHQMGAHLVARGGSALYLTVHTETHHTLFAQARTLSFFDPATVAAERFRYVSLSGALDAGGVSAVREHIAQLVQAYAPTLVAVDGLHMIRLLDDDDRAFHRFMIFLQTQAALAGVTTLALTNYEGTVPADALYAVPDGIVHLRTVRYGMREVRRMAIAKLRGSRSLGGWHDYTLGRNGLCVYPRFEAKVEAAGVSASQPSTTRAAFGIPGLDALLGGGVPGASVTLLAGAPGAGKTLLGLAFLAEGARRGERGLYLGFRESPDRIVAKADGVGLGVGAMRDAGLLDIEWIAPLEVLIDALADRLVTSVLGALAPGADGEVADGTGTARIRRVFVDGLDDLRRTCLEADRLPALLAAITDMLRAHGVSMLLSQEFRQPFGPDLSLPVDEMAGAVDNVVLLRYREDGLRLRRLVSVLKLREHAYHPDIRDFAITADGVRVDGDLMVGDRGDAADPVTRPDAEAWHRGRRSPA